MFGSDKVKKVVFKDFSGHLEIKPEYNGRRFSYDTEAKLKVKNKKGTITFSPKNNKDIQDYIDINFYDVEEIIFENSNVEITDLKKNMNDFSIIADNSSVNFKSDSLFTYLYLNIKNNSKVSFENDFACPILYIENNNSILNFSGYGYVGELEELIMKNATLKGNEDFFVYNIFRLDVEGSKSILDLQVIDKIQCNSIENPASADLQILSEESFKALEKEYKYSDEPIFINKSIYFDAYQELKENDLSMFGTDFYVDEYYILEDCEDFFNYPYSIKNLFEVKKQLDERAVDPEAYDRKIAKQKLEKDISYYKDFFNKEYPTESLHVNNRAKFIDFLTKVSNNQSLLDIYELNSELELKNIKKMCFVLDIPLKLTKEIASF